MKAKIRSPSLCKNTLDYIGHIVCQNSQHVVTNVLWVNFEIIILVHDTVRFIRNNIDCTLKALHATNISRDSLLTYIESYSEICYYYARILFSISFNVSSYSTSDKFIHSGHLSFFRKYRLRVF